MPHKKRHYLLILLIHLTPLGKYDAKQTTRHKLLFHSLRTALPSLTSLAGRMQVLRFDHTNVDLRATTALARIQCDAFKTDPIKQAFWPAEAQFADLPPVADWEAMQRRVDLFGRVVRSVARRSWLNVSRDPRCVLYLLQCDGQCVAAARWRLPEQHPVPPVPWYRCLWLWFVARIFQIADCWSFGGRNPLDERGLGDALARMGDQLGSRKTPTICQDLREAPAATLASMAYPKEWSYHLSLLVVRGDAQSHGFGKHLLLESQADITAGHVCSRTTVGACTIRARPPPGVNGPPKVSLTSSPTAVGFYEKIGYTASARHDSVLPNGVPITRVFFFRNLE